jgi:hypothetical protein
MRLVCKIDVTMPIKHERHHVVSLKQHRGFQCVFVCMRLYTHGLLESVTFLATMCGQLAWGVFSTARCCVFQVCMHNFATHKMLFLRCCPSVTSQYAATYFSAYRVSHCHRGIQVDLVIWSLSPVIRIVCQGNNIMPIKHVSNLVAFTAAAQGLLICMFLNALAHPGLIPKCDVRGNNVRSDGWRCILDICCACKYACTILQLQK